MNAGRRGLVVILCSWLLALTACGAQKEAAVPAAMEVKHSPKQPRSGQAVTISAIPKTPLTSVSLEYQIVEPGAYVALKDSEYKSRWVPLRMQTNGNGGFSAEIPGVIQVHRRLVRYRLKGVENGGQGVAAPAANDPEPNFAYFVYDGIPSWKAAIQPGGGDEKKRQAVEFGNDVMGQVQSYFLLGKIKDVENATWYQQSFGKDYHYTGTFVANGKVYDHVRFRARGGVWRYAMGKNMWKIDFNKGHHLQALNDYGQTYKTKWGKLNLRACIQQGDYGRRGEQGMYESVGFRLFNLAGVDAPRTHWISLRIVDGKEENPADQYRGDFWGLYLAIENEDGHFLEEHGLPEGNLFKMMNGQGELSNHADNQPEDGSDLRRLINAYHGRQNDAWWRANVDLPRYYSYRSILEAIHHYDVVAGKNYDFYFNPESAKWCVIPWDIDLSWGDHMYGNGVEPFQYPVLSRGPFRLEYENRLREIRDLLFNPDETDRLIDECAAIIARPGQLSIVDADRAKWDFHPIMRSRYAMGGKAGQGLFYQDSPTGDFTGMVRQMKEYVRRRANYIDRSLLRDGPIPQTPVITYAGIPGYPINGLRFKTSNFAGAGSFAAMRWRIGEIDAPKEIRGKSSKPGRYEITPVWESAELTEFRNDVAIPEDALKPEHVYRARARVKDATGRWSHWSPPVQFTAGAIQ
ncbi:MAG TPA: CotH kinase family protein [Verrucomicrobiae bacterium]|jgi:hypothetical protein|nr:CotH kinase family protein [Verrucomicrobiae bacterium]